MKRTEGSTRGRQKDCVGRCNEGRHEGGESGGAWERMYLTKVIGDKKSKSTAVPSALP